MNKIKIFGIIAFIAITGFSLMGCGKTGGTFEFKNSTESNIMVYAAKGDSAPDFNLVTYKEKKPGEIEVVELTEDGTVFFSWYYINNPISKRNDSVSISRGSTVTREAIVSNN